MFWKGFIQIWNPEFLGVLAGAITMGALFFGVVGLASYIITRPKQWPHKGDN